MVPVKLLRIVKTEFESVLITGFTELCNNISAEGRRINNIEFICKTDPEVILWCGMSKQDRKNAEKFFFEKKEFQKITAVKNRRIIFLDPAKFCRLTPQLIDEIINLRLRVPGKFQQ